MTRLFAAELDKMVSTRLWLWLLAAAMAITAVLVSLAIGFSDTPETWTMPLETAAGQRTLFAIAASGAAPLAAVLGAVAMTGEFRHRTATATFLAVPRRGRVVAAKVAIYGAVGACYGLACLAVSVVVTLPWLTAKGIPITTGWLLETSAGVVATVAVYGVIGVGVGALVRDQAASVVGLLIYRFVIEPIFTQVPAFESWTRFLPGAADGALRGVTLTTTEYLVPWLGGVVLAAYGLAFAVAGASRTVRQDVT